MPMQITTNSQIDPLGRGDWAVIAEWMGQERTVFRGSIWACIAWRERNG